MRPKLKPVVWYRDRDDLMVFSGTDELLTIEDVDGELERLLGLLADGERTVEELTDAERGIGSQHVRDVIDALDHARLLVDADAGGSVSPRDGERYICNLEFFDGYASLGRDAVAIQRDLRDAHVVVLGVGGIGCNVMMNLVGLGVGRLTVVDSDVVEPRNFVWQWVYRERDIGCAKVECATRWVREFDRAVRVQPIHRRVEGVSDIAPLLGDAGLVIAAMDEPHDLIEGWVNEACVTAGVPFVCGGLTRRRGLYFSVDPGQGPCLACREHNRPPTARERATAGGADNSMVERFFGQAPGGIGPAVMVLGGLLGLEATRYLTGFAPPIARGIEWSLDLVTGEHDSQPWEPWPDCDMCARAPARHARAQGQRAPASATI